MAASWQKVPIPAIEKAPMLLYAGASAATLIHSIQNCGRGAIRR